jgi:hypothetical protein
MIGVSTSNQPTYLEGRGDEPNNVVPILASFTEKARRATSTFGLLDRVEGHQGSDSARMIAIVAPLGLGVLGALGTWLLALTGRIGLQILASGYPRKSSYQGRRALHLVDEAEPVGLATNFAPHV